VESDGLQVPSIGSIDNQEVVQAVGGSIDGETDAPPEPWSWKR